MSIITSGFPSTSSLACDGCGRFYVSPDGRSAVENFMDPLRTFRRSAETDGWLVAMLHCPVDVSFIGSVWCPKCNPRCARCDAPETSRDPTHWYWYESNYDWREGMLCNECRKAMFPPYHDPDAWNQKWVTPIQRPY